jgi:RNA polymerase sigma-70 factor, ECF subfamily
MYDAEHSRTDDGRLQQRSFGSDVSFPIPHREDQLMAIAEPHPRLWLPYPEALPVGAAEPVSELWRTHGSALLRFAQKLTLGDRQRAEDIVQETLFRAWRHPEVLGTGRAPIRAWLFTVARRIAIDMWRARTDEPPDGRQPDLPDPADCIERVIIAIDVRAALATLNPPHRQVITEVYYNNHSIAETAAILGIPPAPSNPASTTPPASYATPSPPTPPTPAPRHHPPPTTPLGLTPAGITTRPGRAAGLVGRRAGHAGDRDSVLHRAEAGACWRRSGAGVPTGGPWSSCRPPNRARQRGAGPA